MEILSYVLGLLAVFGFLSIYRHFSVIRKLKNEIIKKKVEISEHEIEKRYDDDSLDELIDKANKHLSSKRTDDKEGL